MKFIKNLFLYFSAFVPLFFLLFVKIIVDIINNNLTFNLLNTVNLCLLNSMIIFGIFGLLWNTKLSSEKTHMVKIKTAKDITDQYFLQYFSLFVLFAVPLDISYVNMFCIYIFVLIFIGIVYIKCGLYYINPLLNILGYRFYSVTLKSLETGKLRDVKIFCKEKLLNNTYEIKILNDNFAFVIKKVVAKNGPKSTKNDKTQQLAFQKFRVSENPNDVSTPNSNNPNN